jgi:hypothetical protein
MRTSDKEIGQKYLLNIINLIGGARRSRTADLLNAIQALSQLSYGPFRDIRPLCIGVAGFRHTGPDATTDH